MVVLEPVPELTGEPVAFRTAPAGVGDPLTQQVRLRQVHLPALDGLRGLAILLVLGHHLLWSDTPPADRALAWVVKWRFAGWVGVDVFFVLSGFLITGIVFDSLGEADLLKNFYARRALRIFPLYYGVIGALFVTTLFLNAEARRPLYLLLGFLQNTPLWFQIPWAKDMHGLTSHLWSLAVEEQFYLVWPLVVFTLRRRRSLMWAAGLLTMVAILLRVALLRKGVPFEWTYKLACCRMDSLLTGAWLALAWRGPERGRILRAAPWVFAGAACVCATIAWRAGNFFWMDNRALNEYGFTFVAIGCTALLAMTLQHGSLPQRWMQAGSLRFFGRYSYGIYVYHQLFALTAMAYLGPAMRRAIPSKVLFHLLFAALLGCFSVAVAVLSYELWELPFLRLKRFFKSPARLR